MHCPKDRGPWTGPSPTNGNVLLSLTSTLINKFIRKSITAFVLDGTQGIVFMDSYEVFHPESQNGNRLMAVLLNYAKTLWEKSELARTKRHERKDNFTHWQGMNGIDEGGTGGIPMG